MSILVCTLLCPDSSLAGQFMAKERLLGPMELQAAESGKLLKEYT
ncbi:hypothetical protein TELCIR_07232 [Teladorsagia circumcincta]|uniref:Uncharacterized protein n=1 Tax=Teladorsagia circumcincta TaxID=45464 RepID=A0A2G9UKT6_TELCI|nr:hypothetical protein TELCIR_07232 [Teladorsagia circumcincta]